MSISVLMVAEKPSICTSIASALSRGNMESRGRTPPVHEFQGHFLDRPAFIRVTSVTGHVFSTDFPVKYQNWDTVDPFDLFQAPVVHSPEGKGGIVKHLEREAKGMDYLVLWLDCDREGENICFEVIKCVEHSMKKGVRGQTIFRARFSAVTPKDIEKAMKSLVSPNENEALAVDARQELDLKVGVAFSRFQTRYFQGKYGNLDSAIISYGPCQTPTLGFCVERYDEIASFVPEQFWCIDCTLEIHGRMIPVEWERGRLFDQSIVDTFLYLINQDRDLRCTDVKTSTVHKPRPQPLNTVELLKLASKNLGISPQATMRAAEHLYLSGYLSYPRTESTAYPSSFDFHEALTIQRPHSEWGWYARELLTNGYSAPRQGHDAGDHPPITPVGLATDISGDEARIYELVVRHFLATISKDATYLSTKARFVGAQCKEEFSVSGKRELDPGYMVILGHSRSEGCSELPSDITAGQSYRISALKIRQGVTSAPGYLSESELIGLMEKHKIGTDASIPTHINNIMVRNYVTLGQGRTLIPTELGIVLVHGYLRIDPDLVLPDVRAAIEMFCDLIAKGEASKQQVVSHSLRNFEAKFQHFASQIGRMDALFEATFSPLAATGKNMSKCGRCSRYMRYIPLKPQRLYCPTCEETYSLPQNGTIKLYKELKCPLDQFELVLFSLGNTDKAQGKTYSLCPYCYNHTPSFKSFEALLAEGDDDGGHGHDGVEPNAASSSVKVSLAVPDLEDYGNSKRSAKSAKLAASAAKPSSSGSGRQQKHQAAEEHDNDAEGDEGDDDEEEEDEEGEITHMGCNSCLHPSCKHSAVTNVVCKCPDSTDTDTAAGEGSSSYSSTAKGCSGMLVLDVNSKPNWKLACNVCNTLLRFKKYEIHAITPVARQECPTCSIRLLQFEFNKTNTPLKNNETVYIGCIVCDEFLNACTELVTGRSMNITVLRQIRYKRSVMSGRAGRGRRGGGRGGRGGKGGDVKMSFSDF